MSQDTAFGKCEIVTYIKVEKANGTVKYLRVAGGISEEISRERYYAEGGQ